MKQEEKNLLLKDLCARLPYNPMVEYKGEIYNVLGIAHGRLILCKPFMSQTLEYCPLVEEAKPYLLPQSSMTEEQEEELIKYMAKDWNGMRYHTPDSIDWLIKNNFDYRCLIPKDLAKDATGKIIY